MGLMVSLRMPHRGCCVVSLYSFRFCSISAVRPAAPAVKTPQLAPTPPSLKTTLSVLISPANALHVAMGPQQRLLRLYCEKASLSAPAANPSRSPRTAAVCVCEQQQPAYLPSSPACR